MTAGHVGQARVAAAATNFDRLVGEGEGGVEEVNISCGGFAFEKMYQNIFSFSLYSSFQDIPSFMEEHFFSPISILSWRIEPASGEDEGFPE